MLYWATPVQEVAMRAYVLLLSVPLLFLLTACPSRKDGAIEGSVAPAGPGIRATVSVQGRAVASAEADVPTGRDHGAFTDRSACPCRRYQRHCRDGPGRECEHPCCPPGRRLRARRRER